MISTISGKRKYLGKKATANFRPLAKSSAGITSWNRRLLRQEPRYGAHLLLESDIKVLQNSDSQRGRFAQVSW